MPRPTPLYTALTIALAANLAVLQSQVLAQAPAAPPRYVTPPPAVLPPGGIKMQPTPTPAAPAQQKPPAASPAPAAAAPAPQTPVAQPAAAPPAATTPAAAAPAPAPQTQPAQPAGPAPTVPGSLNLTNASLTEVIDLLARDLHINYIIDPRVKGSVTINTYGEIKPTDLRPLLETILRMNGFQMVQVGNMYRIVPVAEAGRLPVSPVANATALSDDERLVLNLVFLKYVTSTEMSKLLEPFNGEGAKMMDYAPANLLVIEDNSRNMKRTMDLIAMFDSDTLAGQRVHSYTVTNGRPTDIAKELDSVFKSYAMSEKSASVKFIPIDRINTVIAVAPNPGTFTRVDEWIKKLDVPVKATAGSVGNHVYRLKYGRAEIIGSAISQLYGGSAGVGFSGYGQSQFGNLSTTGLSSNGQLGGGVAYGSGIGGAAGGTFGGGNLGGGNFGGAQGGMNQGGGTAGTGGLFNNPGAGAAPGMTNPLGGAMGTNQPGGRDLTGQYLAAGMGGNQLPRIIPNPYDNTLLIQSTPEQWASIQKLLEDLDIPPRQVLIDAKIYEVDLSGDLQYGVESFLQRKDNANGPGTAAGLTAQFVGQATSSGVALSTGFLAGRSRELLMAITASDLSTKTKMIASPSIIATDSIPAAINVGVDVPVLESQAITGAQSAGSSLFANTIGSRSTGVTLGLVARINASGVVTLVINQQFSQPNYPSAGAAIQSPSFSQRTVSTQVTVQDGDTIAIGGIIQEDNGVTSSGIPFLTRLPLIGGAFGTKHYTHDRSELLIFLTPRVIFDTNQVQDASQELKERMTHLKRVIKDE